MSYRSARKTIAAARHSGLSVGDYIDRNFAEPGATQATVDALLQRGGLSGHVERVCEIGPGSGRYAEKVISALRPDVYEAYETAPDWLPHLRELPNLITQPCDGHTLGSTTSASADLVHAHKLFVYIPFHAVAGYLEEMARVVRPGGVVAFDVVTEGCIDQETVDSWIAQGSFFSPIPRSWVIDFLGRRDLSLSGSAFVSMADGWTELLVFQRTPSSKADATD